MIYVQVGNKIVKEIIFFFLWRNEKHCLNCSDKILLELIQLVLALKFICHWNSTYFEKFLSAKFIGQLMRVPQWWLCCWCCKFIFSSTCKMLFPRNAEATEDSIGTKTSSSSSLFILLAAHHSLSLWWSHPIPPSSSSFSTY